jgi:uncharacterized protein YdcH (DUF465 family)
MNAANAEEIQHQLLEQDQHYRQLSERHHILDDRLTALVQRPYLSTSEQLEESALKKEKLAVKDQMAQRVRAWSQEHRSAD